MKNVKKVALGSALALGSVAAHAALPTEATAAFTDIQTAVTDVVAAVWPIAALVLTSFITLKLVKRGANKAT